MTAKAVLAFCAQALLAQCIASQCIGSTYNGLALAGANGLGWDAAAPWGAASWNAYAEAPIAAFETGYRPAASNGGGFTITSASPISPVGVSVTSENAYEGPLAVTGAVPFLGAIALEGALPTAGAGTVTYGCGNGNVAMLSEDIAAGFNAYGGAYGYGADLGYGYPGLGYEAGLAGPAYGYGINRGCGCGALY